MKTTESTVIDFIARRTLDGDHLDFKEIQAGTGIGSEQLSHVLNGDMAEAYYMPGTVPIIYRLSRKGLEFFARMYIANVQFIAPDIVADNEYEEVDVIPFPVRIA